MRVKAVFLLLVALGCGVVASAAIGTILEDSHTVPTANLAHIVVADSGIQVGTVITPGDVSVRQWPSALVPQHAFESLESVVGRRATQNIFAGEPVLAARIGESNDTTVARSVRPGFRVITFTVAMDTAVAGMIQPGDRVDLLAYLRRSDEIRQTTLRTILEDARVFAMDNRVALDLDVPANVSVRTVSLEVAPEDAQRIALAGELGKLRLVMRNPVDVSRQGNDGVRAGDLLRDSNQVEIPARPESQPVVHQPEDLSFTMVIHTPTTSEQYRLPSAGGPPLLTPHDSSSNTNEPEAVPSAGSSEIQERSVGI